MSRFTPKRGVMQLCRGLAKLERADRIKRIRWRMLDTEHRMEHHTDLEQRLWAEERELRVQAAQEQTERNS